MNKIKRQEGIRLVVKQDNGSGIFYKNNESQLIGYKGRVAVIKAYDNSWTYVRYLKEDNMTEIASYPIQRFCHTDLNKFFRMETINEYRSVRFQHMLSQNKY